jgi:Methyltransferase domain
MAPMTQAAESHPSVTVYTPARLALYDLFILGFSCRFVWRCPKRHFLALYDRYTSARHLDVGVGTGYFLDRCRFPADRPQLTLLDLSEACLTKASQRLARYSPQVVKANVLEPLELGSARFGSVGLNGVLHCLPGTLETKAVVFQHLKPFVEEGGLVFGSTILGQGVEHGRLARKALALYNREGIFTNLGDDPAGLERVLASEFSEHRVERRGSFALFVARR